MLADHDRRRKIRPQDHLPLVRYRLRFSGPPAADLPGFAGSAWRGAFGHALRDAACATGASRCDGCLLYYGCTYAYLFETPPPPSSTKMRRYPAAPHPFLLDPEGYGSDGGDYRLTVPLFGRGAAYWPQVVHALEQAGRRGLGGRRQPFILRGMERETAPGSGRWESAGGPGAPVVPAEPAHSEVPESPGRLRIRLLTPLRVQRQGSLVPPESFGMGDMLAPLIRRLSLLSYFHGWRPLEGDFASLTEHARSLPLREAGLHWQEAARRSGRQGRRVPAGGLVGELVTDIPNDDPLWPFLWLGQWVHAGKGTVMGLGKYRIEDHEQGCPV